ncbi:MAG: recombinase family protein [Actinomycetota bacterium]|nr:recombinase family protein [Actinomycetota bacterium]
MTTRRRKPARTSATTTVVGYTRVSTSDQADSGAGLAAQQTAIRAECARRGWVLAAIHSDSASGASMKGRTALAEALAALATGQAQGLVVAKLDRLSRSLCDFAGLLATAEREGWALCALDAVDMSSPGGEFLANVMASAAQWERRIIGVRTREGLAAKRAQGVRLGRRVGLPAEVRDRITEQREAGLTLAAIAAALNADAVPTAQGGALWHPSTVRAVLASLQRDAERAAVLAGLAERNAA